MFDPKAKEKADVLDDGGYWFDYIHLTYVNRARKALFSHLFVEAHSPEEIGACIARANPSQGWQFFFLKPPHPDMRSHLEAAYSR